MPRCALHEVGCIRSLIQLVPFNKKGSYILDVAKTKKKLFGLFFGRRSLGDFLNGFFERRVDFYPLFSGIVFSLILLNLIRQLFELFFGGFAASHAVIIEQPWLYCRIPEWLVVH